MIRVTVEIIPYGREDLPGRKTLSTVNIGNDMTGDIVIGNYRIYSNSLSPDDTFEERVGLVKGHKRQSNVLTLVRKALESLDY